MEGEIGVMCPQAKGCPEPLGAGRSKEWILPRAFRACRHLILESGLWNCEGTNL